MSSATIQERVTAQRALEALRNGVPNSDAVRALGCMQPEALDRFRAQLAALEAAGSERLIPLVPGNLIAGDFGVGKSHTLAFFEQDALERNFVVSKVVISKETPLFDASKLFAAAVREARLPKSRGSLLHELAIRLDFQKPPTASFMDWVAHKQPYGMLGASALIYERSHDAELQEQIINWWSGEKLGVAQVRKGLKELGTPKAFQVKAVKLVDLAPIRFEFAARLVRAAGFAGWVILLDELELIGRYSLLQRGRSYAELARWLGAVTGYGVPGITTVAAITDDFSIKILDERGDRDTAPARLQKKGDAAGLAAAQMAEAGMKAITTPHVRLNQPNDDTLALSFSRIRELYETAYGEKIGDRTNHRREPDRRMREYVRRWITEWDLQRLFPGHGQESLVEVMPQDDSEDLDLESDSAESGEDQT